MGLLQLFTLGGSGASNAGRREFLRQLTGGAVSAALAPREQAAPAAKEVVQELVLPKPLTVNDAADFVHGLFVRPELARQIIYAARASHAAQTLLAEHLQRDRLRERWHDTEPAPSADLLRHSLQLSVNLAMSGAPQWISSAGDIPLESNPTVLHAARIMGAGVQCKGGLTLPLYSAGTRHGVDPVGYDPRIIYSTSLALRHAAGKGAEHSLSDACLEAVRSGLSPAMIPEFYEVLQERRELFNELERRGSPPAIARAFESDPLLKDRFRVFNYHGELDWETFFSDCGGVFGLAVNLPLTLRALQVFETPERLQDSDHSKVMQAVLNPTVELSAWLKELPAFKALHRLQPVLAQVSSLCHPPAEVIIRHSGLIQMSILDLENAGVPREFVVSPLAGGGDIYNKPVDRLFRGWANLLERFSAWVERQNCANSYQPAPDFRFLGTANFSPPIPVSLGEDTLISASRVEHLETTHPSGATSLWMRFETRTGESFFKELTESNIGLSSARFPPGARTLAREFSYSGETGASPLTDRI